MGADDMRDSLTGPAEPAQGTPTGPLQTGVTRLAGVNLGVALCAVLILSVFEKSADNASPWKPPIDQVAQALGVGPGGRSRLTRFASIAAQSQQWVAGKRRLFESVFSSDDEADRWNAPPAGQAIEAPFRGAVGMLVIAGQNQLPESVTLEVDLPTDTLAFWKRNPSVKVKALPYRLGPFWVPGTKVQARLTMPGWFGTRFASRQSEWHVHEISDNAEEEWSFPEAEGWAGPVRLVPVWEPSIFDHPIGQAFVPLRVEATCCAAPSQFRFPGRASGEENEVITIVAPVGLSNANAIEVTGRRRHIGLYLWSPTGRLPKVRARRSDTGQFIGMAAPDLPIFVAVADKWSSIVVELVQDERTAGQDLRLLMVSDREDPSVELFIESLGWSLPSFRLEGIPPDRETRLRAGRWLRDALGVNWTAQDIEELRSVDTELAGVLTQLVN